MTVKVNPKYPGTFGQYDENTRTVHAKKAGDPAFIVPDHVAKKMIIAGVLVMANSKSTESEPTKKRSRKS